MPLLESRFYVTADGEGRVETSTHPQSGKRVWGCTSCTLRGEGEENGRDHAACCDNSRNALMNHFL